MKRNSLKTNVNSTKSSSTKARDLMCKMATIPDWHIPCFHTQKFTNLRPSSSPFRVFSRNGFQNVSRPSSSMIIANPILSFKDVKRILFQKITDKGDELIKAFQLLDTSHNMTVSKSELRRIVSTFLLPLTKEQFQDLLAQVTLTSSAAVPYLHFLSRFGGIDINVNVTKRASRSELDCCRTLKELELQVGHKIFKNIKAVIRAFKLIDVNKTGWVQPQELRRVLETFCLRMRDDEYKKFAETYNINKDTAVDYNAFLKNFSINNNLNLTRYLGNQGASLENQQAKNATRDSLRSSQLSEHTWEDHSLDDLGRAFCQELSKCREKVEKALSAGDPSKCGYISLNYLKIVLDTFVHRLPRRTFILLMKRFGLRTTSRINWKQFLTLVHDPQWTEAQSSGPLTEKDGPDPKNQCCGENILTKLFRCEEHYMLLRKALLLVNAKVDGQIKAEELQDTINSMVVKLSNADFQELMQTLDPEGTGLVDVNRFIELLENSCAKPVKPSSGADTQTPILLEWDPVEEMVRNAVSRNFLAFYDLLRSYDLSDTGLMGANNFKKVMHIFCPCLTMENLTRLCSKFQDSASGRILYKNLLASMGVQRLPTAPPAAALKSLPSCEHFQKEQPPPERAGRTQPLEDKRTLTKNVTKGEAVEKLKHWIQQRDPAFKNRFLDFSKDLNGRIGTRDFRKVLEDSGAPMSDDQYAQLTAAIGYKREGMSYPDLAAGFEGAKTKGPQVTPPKTTVLPKHHLIGRFVTAEECLKHLPERLKESFPDLYGAFFWMDTNRDGIISMQDLHRLLEQLLFNIKDDQFEHLVALLGLRLSVTLNFREFRHLFEKTPPMTDNEPQKFIRTKQKVTDSELACQQAHQYLATKAKNRWLDLSKTFIEADDGSASILRPRDIKNALYGFDIPLTPREFEKLWMRYDTKGRGHITYQEFVEHLGIEYSADVHRPYMEDRSNLMGHFAKPPQEPEAHPAQQPQPSADTAQPAREKLRDHREDIRRALAKLDKSSGGSVSLRQLHKALQEGGCPLAEGALTELLGSWGISWQNNTVNYLDFLRAMEEGKPPRPEPREGESDVPVNFAKLGPEEVLKNVQKVVAAFSPALTMAFSALDKEDTGFVKPSDFGQVLKDFCHKLTDSQFHCFLRKLRLHLTPCVNWKYFLQSFGCFPEEGASEWAEKMPKVPPPKSPKEMADREILARLHKAVASHYQAIAQEFENFDTAKSSTTSKEEFRAICTRHVQVLTDEQFDRLWREMPVDAKGRLKYLDFLSQFNSEKVPTPPSSGDSTKAHRRSEGPPVSGGGRPATASPPWDPKAGTKPQSVPNTASSAGTVLGTPLLHNCEPIESKLRRRVQGCWREFLRECKERDVHRQGDIATADFLALAEKFKLGLSEEESQQLIVKYDIKDNGRFAYCDFLQCCVLLLRAQETSLMQRMKVQNANKVTEAGAASSSLYAALLRIQPQIVRCWRPMRRTFKTYDKGGTGLVGVTDFRKVLRQYSINLSEEEFFHILEYYDRTLSSLLSYNDFLRAFLQ